jgi:predicted DNA-binding transcriptional regulator AlpA
MPTETPQRHHLDRRAADLAAQGAGDADDLLSTSEVAEWLAVSHQFLEIARHRGGGPAFIRLGPRRVRYSRQAVRDWLHSRTHASTAEYENGRVGRPRKEAADEAA